MPTESKLESLLNAVKAYNTLAQNKDKQYQISALETMEELLLPLIVQEEIELLIPENDPTNREIRKLLRKLPVKLKRIILQNITSEENLKTLAPIIFNIYISNITNYKDKEDHLSRKKIRVAEIALKKAIKQYKNAFTPEHFNTIFHALWEEDSIDVDVAVPQTTIQIKKSFQIKHTFKKYDIKIQGEMTVVFLTIKGDAAIEVVIGKYSDATYTSKCFANTFDVLAGKISSSLMKQGTSIKPIEGYEWFSINISLNALNQEHTLGLDTSIDKIKLLSYSGNVTATPPLIDLEATAFDELTKLCSSINFVASLSGTLTLGEIDRGLLKTIQQKGKALITKTEESAKLLKELETKKDAIVKAKEKYSHLIDVEAPFDKWVQQDYEELNKAVDKVKDAIEKNKQAIEKLQKEIIAHVDELSKLVSPLGKKLVKEIGEKALTVALKFVPGLNIVSTAIDIYDVATVLFPAMKNLAISIWEDITKIIPPPEFSDRVKDFFTANNTPEYLRLLDQKTADDLADFFDTFKTEEDYLKFKDRYVNSPKNSNHGGKLSDYVQVLKDAKEMFKEEVIRLKGMDENMQPYSKIKKIKILPSNAVVTYTLSIDEDTTKEVTIIYYIIEKEKILYEGEPANLFTLETREEYSYDIQGKIWRLPIHKAVYNDATAYWTAM